MKPTLIKLTHANTNTALYLSGHLVAGFYFSPGNQCVHVVASGGAIFPAKESVDDIKRLLNGEDTSPSQAAGGGSA